MKITVCGSGYVGLVTGACLAEMGNHVVCLDIDPDKIALLQGGGVPIHEPGLEPLIQRNTSAGRLQFTTDADLAVQHGTLQFIAVGTPQGEDGSADLSHVVQAARTIGQRMTDYKLIVGKSTVPVGTGDVVEATVREALRARGMELAFSVASNPEFLKEGAAINDFMKPDRVVIGTDDDRAIHLLRALYSPFLRNRDRLLVMDRRSAELTKYAANAMPGHTHQLHERDGQSGRTRGCRHRAGAPGNRQRSAHWDAVSVSRVWIRRIVFSEGREGIDSIGSGRGPSATCSRSGRGSKRTAETHLGR
jgi:UDPglucose 6-dehydrogenase